MSAASRAGRSGSTARWTGRAQPHPTDHVLDLACYPGPCQRGEQRARAAGMYRSELLDREPPRTGAFERPSDRGGQHTLPAPTG